jgi:outer membrane protein assembly factor BamB
MMRVILNAGGNKMKLLWLIIISAILVCASSENFPSWDQYLGNPGRTGYSNYGGPDFPEIFWKINLPGYPGTPFIIEDKILVLYKDDPFIFTDSKIASIDLLTGTLLDEAVADVKNLTGVFPAGDLLLGITRGGWLYRINFRTKEAVLDLKIPDHSPLSCDPHCFPIILSDKVVFPTNPVVCLSRDDYSLLWNLQSSLGSMYPENAETYAIAASSKQVHIVLWGESGGDLLTVDSNTGKLVWQDNSLNFKEIALDGSILIGGKDKLYAMNPETGELFWTFESEQIHSNIVIGPESVFFTGNDMIYAIDKTSGELQWQTQLEGVKDSPFSTTYLIGVKNAIICSNTMNLTAFSLINGAELWNVHFQDHVDRLWNKPCPAVSENILVVIGEEPQTPLISYTSDPELFAQQGDAFLSRELPDKAAESYRKASELYERKGDHEKAQEMEKKISQLESSPESAIPPKTQSYIIPISFILGMVIISILIYLFLIQKRSK